ncbi:MAG: hypothetical protein AB1489_21570 [Acidobacteriota bacterium]
MQNSIIELITELEQTNGFPSSLYRRIELEFARLHKHISQESKTAQALRCKATWRRIAEEAQSDSQIYGDYTYREIARLASATEIAWQRCIYSQQFQLEY